MAIEELEGFGKMYRIGPGTQGQYSYAVSMWAGTGKRTKRHQLAVGGTPQDARKSAAMLTGQGWTEGAMTPDQIAKIQRQAQTKNFTVQEWDEAGLTPPTTPIIAPKPATATVVVNPPAKNPLDEFVAWLKSIMGR